MSTIVTQEKWIKNRCPFCQEKLGVKELLMRKGKKVFVCKKCGKKIDERFIIYCEKLTTRYYG